MAEILVVHPTLMAKGGAESVCMNVLEALSTDHRVTLLTAEDPDFNELNRYYSMSVREIPTLSITGVSGIAQQLPTAHATRLKLSLLNGYIIKHDLGDEYDLVFSTYNELRLPYRSIQYIHHPNFNRELLPEEGENYPSPVYWIYDSVCERVARAPKKDAGKTKFLTNSDWMSDRVREMLGTRPQTVYPPVNTANFNPREWKRRERGVITIGRIRPEKNILRNIKIITELHDRGHDIHYHILGPTSDRVFPFSETYAEEVKSASENHEFVHLEGEVSRERLVEMIATHRYGLHGMDHEHFGIAVAELVAGGTIPFVPRGGGQVEVVDGCEAILYGSVEEAVDKMDAVLSDEKLQDDIRAQLPDVEARFGRDRFQQEIRQITNDVLS